jgi:integrase
LSPIKIKEPETQPLTEAEYKKVLSAARKTRMDCRIYTLIQLMRWSGLAIRDAALLKRTDLVVEDGKYNIIRERQKTGANLYIPLKPEIGREVIAALNGNPVYVFWDKQTAESSEYNAASHWGTKVSQVFKAAGIETEGHMVSHRLRDTYAVDLLQKGVPLEHVSKLLGHKSVSTTERHYARWSKGRQDLLDSVVSQTW